MPSNIFATTGTNVSILFIDKTGHDQAVLIDASALGTKVKEGRNQKTVLSAAEERRIVDTFNARRAEDDFSVVVDLEAIKAKNYSFSAGQYFEVRIEYEALTPEEFDVALAGHRQRLQAMFAEGRELECSIDEALGSLRYG